MAERDKKLSIEAPKKTKSARVRSAGLNPAVSAPGNDRILSSKAADADPSKGVEDPSRENLDVWHSKNSAAVPDQGLCVVSYAGQSVDAVSDKKVDIDFSEKIDGNCSDCSATVQAKNHGRADAYTLGGFMTWVGHTMGYWRRRDLPRV